jgi:hypothetical protein
MEEVREMKKKKVLAPKTSKPKKRYLHVAISAEVMGEWVRFRKARSMFRGPLEEHALVRFMEENSRLPSVSVRPELSE